jgi:hypothetical protein
MGAINATLRHRLSGSACDRTVIVNSIPMSASGKQTATADDDLD